MVVKHLKRCVNSVVFREIQINIRLSSFIIMTTFKELKGNWYSYIVQFSSGPPCPIFQNRAPQCFLKKTRCKYFRLCRLYTLCHCCSALLLQHESIYFETDEHCLPMKMCLMTLKFECHINFISHNSFLFFSKH